MGLDFSNFEWTPNTMGKNWMSVCNFYGNMMPFLGQTLWQVGPMPFITQGWFPNTNYGNWGDQFVSSYTPGAGGGGNDSTTLTKEDKDKLKTQKKDIIDYNKKYNAMLDALTEYKKTLSDTDKVGFDTDLSLAYINLSSKRSTTTPSSNNLKTIENSHKQAKKAYEELLDIYNEYNKDNAVSKAYKEFLNIKTTEAKNEGYASTVSDLSSWIENPEGIFEDIITTKEDGSYKWNSDVDVMELLSTWNSTEGKNHLIQTIVAKYNALNDIEPKKYLEAFTEKLCDQLRVRANGIKENKLSNHTKDLLKDAKNAFPSSIRSSDLNTDQVLATKFDDLYKAVRLAEAEIADKELEEAFDFLGADNPYKNKNNNNNFNETKTDLGKEDIDVNNVTTPPVNPTQGENNGTHTPANTPTVDINVWKNKVIKFKVDQKEYNITIKFDEDKNVKYRTSKGAALTKETLENLGITDIKLNNDGSYSYKANGAEKKFNKNGDEITNSNTSSQ